MRNTRRSYTLVGDLWHTIRKQRKWWILPLLILIFGAAALVMAAEGAGPLAPFIYPFF